ncbi:hypothetical protein BH10ACI4_BH10ACI4_36180 [soil metagenome]
MSGLVLNRRRAMPEGSTSAFRYAVHVVRGREAILAMQGMLLEFSERCLQPGTMEDLTYFLSKPGLLKRVPNLFLIVKRQNLKLEEVGVDDLMGALFLYEFSVMGFGLRAFATNDRSGRGTMLALPMHRLKVAAIASRVLLDRGAYVIMLSFRLGSGETDKESMDVFDFPSSSRSRITAEWARREREIAGYLPLLDTYDETLATIGQKTRRNLRYYRRRAEAQLGCVLIPEVQIGEEEFLAFNRECMYPVRDHVTRWRLQTMKDLKGPVIMGLKDQEGRWLSLLGGRRNKDRSEILWQMNRDGLSSFSLSTVMRSYCIEHEISMGMKRLYMEGGTAHSVHHSFVREELMDLVVVRRSPIAQMMKKFAQRRVSPDNELADVLKDNTIEWFPC